MWSGLVVVGYMTAWRGVSVVWKNDTPMFAYSERLGWKS